MIKFSVREHLTMEGVFKSETVIFNFIRNEGPIWALRNIIFPEETF